jgi:hypothetical protein
VALDIRARRFRRAPLLHAARKGVGVAARASGHRSRARVHRCRFGCCRCVVRAAVPVLRNTDRSCGAATQYITGDDPRYHASGDDRPNGISDIVPNCIPNSFTLCVRDSVTLRASQHAARFRQAAFSTLPSAACQHFSRVVGLTRGSGEAPRHVFSRDGASSRTDEADMLTSGGRRPERADMLTGRVGPFLNPL